MDKVQGQSLHPPEGQSKGGSSSSSGVGSGSGGNEPVKARNGACATFILNFPMGNASDTWNTSSSSSSGAIASTASASSASLGPSFITGKEKSSLSYAEKMRLIDEKNKEVEMRLSRLSPSFDATQQVRTQQNTSCHTT